MGKVYDCDQWNYEAKGKSTLRNHQKLSIKGAIKEGDLNCDKCDFQSTSTCHLKDHKAVTHSILPFSYKCEK